MKLKEAMNQTEKPQRNRRICVCTHYPFFHAYSANIKIMKEKPRMNFNCKYPYCPCKKYTEKS